MKFYFLHSCRLPGRMTKFLLIMKLSLVLLITAFLEISFAANAQKITLSEKNASLERVLRIIREQSGYSFLYGDEILTGAKPVTIHLNDASVEETLKKCFAKQPLTYTIKDKTVIVQRKVIVKPLAGALQDKEIKGRVTDTAGSPLPGVSVVVKNKTGAGTASDADGKYRLTVQEGDILVFSYLGFKTLEIPVGTGSELNIEMQEDATGLDQVVVVGYTSKQLSQLSSSVSVVSAEQLKDVTSNNVASLLQGKVPGVVVENSSGNPSVNSNITIRGSSSISAGSGPLYVVDGIIGGSANPNDIESVTILKDAAATGLYGSRASNGVIIITTKSGKSGKTQINFSSTVGLNKVSTGNLEMMDSRQLYDFQQSFFPSDVFDQERPASLLSQNTDWLDLAYRTGLTQNYVMSVSGGSEKTQFYISGNYYNEEGVLRHTDNEVYNIRANLSHQISNKLRLSVKFNASSRNFENDASGNYGALVLSTRNVPWDNPYNPDGSIKMGTEERWIGREHDNFLHGWQYNFDKGREAGVYGDLNLDYFILPNLSFSSYNRVSYTNKKTELYYDVRSKAGGGLGELTNNFSYDSKLITSNKLKFDKSFGSHALSIIAVAEGEKNYYDGNSLYGNNIPAGLHIMDAAATIQRSESSPGIITENAFTKGLVQVDYNFDNRYFAVASFINESSSRFGSNNRSANFYTLGSSWLLSNEDFMSGQEIFDQLKIRASYGITGNANIGDYQSLGIYSFTSQYAGNPASIPYQLANENLTWEKAKTLNFGLDIGLFNRVSLTMDWYDKTTHALLLDVPKPYTSGYSSVIQNVGSVQNRGFEFNLNTKNFDGKEFKWETHFNIAINKNKVLALNEGKDIPQYLQRISVGHDLYSWYMRKWAGVDPGSGDPLWEMITTDANGNSTITTTNSYSDAALQFTGTASPDFTGGINNILTYKGFTLRAFFNFVSGNLVWNGIGASDGGEPTSNSRVLAKGHSRWKKAGDIATEPKAVYGGNKDSELESSRFLEDGSYIRLRNITLSYDLPASLINKVKIANARIFISGDNLWTLTDFSGIDPEMGLHPTADLNGDAGNNFQQNSRKYPLSKKMLFGINVGF